ncbi:hypothetical protein [Clostridium tetani]|nr:hypothetical protein [Clostridium tetani]
MEYVSGAHKIEKVKINGVDAVISNDKALGKFLNMQLKKIHHSS